MDNDANAHLSKLERTMVTNMIIRQIRKLGDLHEDGVLTDDEFAKMKAELLSRM